jgi:hypothetical protein
VRGIGQTVNAATTDAGRGRPNIIVVMTDDMRVDELAYMPAVRRLVAAHGLRFANSFSPQPAVLPGAGLPADGVVLAPPRRHLER